jgi:hypothetical protein
MKGQPMLKNEQKQKNDEERLSAEQPAAKRVDAIERFFPMVELAQQMLKVAQAAIIDTEPERDQYRREKAAAEKELQSLRAQLVERRAEVLQVTENLETLKKDLQLVEEMHAAESKRQAEDLREYQEMLRRIGV